MLFFVLHFGSLSINIDFHTFVFFNYFTYIILILIILILMEKTTHDIVLGKLENKNYKFK